MNLIDTVVLVGAINPDSEAHVLAIEYLNLVTSGGADETLVPMMTLIEFDLVMKGRNYTPNQRKLAFSWLSFFVPENKVISNSSHSL